MTTWLDFEKPVLELEQEIQDLKARATAQGLDAGAAIAELERKAESLRREVYASLSAFQRVQLARHPKSRQARRSSSGTSSRASSSIRKGKPGCHLAWSK